MAQRLVSCRIALLAIWIVAAPMVAASPQRSPCVPPAGTKLVEFRSGDNVLRGFIDLPAGTGRHPAIMLIHGGADTDVTADVDYWKEMRTAFRRAGIATLAWDKAGNGCSSGSYSSRLLPIQERATEALAALEILKRRADIDPTRIGLWALSQGGWVAPMVAVRSPSIAYLIVVSGPGRDALSLGLYPAIHVLREAGVSGPEADAAYWTLRRSLAVLRAGGTAEESAAVTAPLRKYPALQKAYGLDAATAESIRVLLEQPEWSIDASVFLEQLHRPTLAIFGERDAVVDWRESMTVYRNSFARSGHRDLTIKTFPEADHEMVPPASARRVGSTVVEGYLETMIEWLAARNFTGKPLTP